MSPHDLLTLITKTGLPEKYDIPAIQARARAIAAQVPAGAPQLLAQLWNDHLPELLVIEARHPEHLAYLQQFPEPAYYMMPQLFFSVLNEHIRQDDTVQLTIPDAYRYQLFFLGWQLQCGTLILTGNVGGAAAEAAGTAHIIIEGNADTIESSIHDSATVEVRGDVRKSAAQGAYDQASIVVHGNVHLELGTGRGHARYTVHGDVYGSVSGRDETAYHIQGSVRPRTNTDSKSVVSGSGNAHITIDGDVDGIVGMYATDHATIEVKGNTGKHVGEKASKQAHIIVRGAGEIGKPHKTFKGVIEINGERVARDIS